MWVCADLIQWLLHFIVYIYVLRVEHQTVRRINISVEFAAFIKTVLISSIRQGLIKQNPDSLIVL